MFQRSGNQLIATRIVIELTVQLRVVSRLESPSRPNSPHLLYIYIRSITPLLRSAWLSPLFVPVSGILRALPSCSIRVDSDITDEGGWPRHHSELAEILLFIINDLPDWQETGPGIPGHSPELMMKLPTEHRYRVIYECC
jgi:hypothetical protein